MPALDDQRAPETAVHLITSIRAKVEEICAQEGATLNEFVNVAVAEKLAHYEHMEWLKRRRPITPGRLAEARRILMDRPYTPPDPGDELPEGYFHPVDLS